jgi:type IV pilus assembly protein PilO
MISIIRQTTIIRRAQYMFACVSVLGLLAFVFFIFWPSRTEHAQLLQTEAQVQMQIQKNEDAARDLSGIKRDVVKLRNLITTRRQLPRTQDLPGFLRDVTGLSQTAGLRQFVYEPQQQRRLALCNELPIALRFGGTFPEIAAFIRHTEALPRLTRTRRMSIKSKDTRTGMVDVEMTLNIYFADAGGDK